MPGKIVRLLAAVLLAAMLGGCSFTEAEPLCVSAAFRTGYAGQEGQVLCLDIQTVPAENYFTPQALVTLVIVLDRDQTDAEIESWEDLMDSGLRVEIPQGKILRRAALGALAYGMDGSLRDTGGAVRYLRQLQEQGRLETGGEPCAATLCFDVQAAERIREGENLAVAVPRTLTFSLGILSEEPVEAGLLPDTLFRMTDGTTKAEGYAASYENARRLTEVEEFQSLTAQTTRIFRRQVLHTRYLAAASGLEASFAAVMAVVLTIFWAASALHRTTREDIHRAILGAGLMIAGWLLVRLVKYNLADNTLNRYAWYSYYLFMLGLPLVLLYIAAVVDLPWPRKKSVPGWMTPFVMAYPLMMGLVMTNDFHNLVFRLIPGGSWERDYTYGPGYFLILGCCSCMVTLAMGLLIAKAGKSPKRWGRLLPLGVVGLLGVYITGYILGIPLIRDSDLTLVICTLAVLLTESVFHSGLIPVNTHYRELFVDSPLSIQLLDSSGTTVLAAAHAEELSPEQRLTALTRPGVPFRKDQRTRLHSRKIRGGTVVWQEDMSDLNTVQEQIRDSVERLRAANSLLSRDGQIRKRKMEAEIQGDLFDRLEQDIRNRTDELSRVIRALPDSPRRQEHTAYITLMLCHIKRRCNFFFLAQEDVRMQGNDLSVYLDELSEFAAYAGVHALVRSSLPAKLEVAAATVCYDFYFFLLAWSVCSSRATLVGQLEQEGEKLVFRVWSSENTEEIPLPEDFRRAAEAVGGEISSRNLEDSNLMELNLGGGEKK